MLEIRLALMPNIPNLLKRGTQSTTSREIKMERAAHVILFMISHLLLSATAAQNGGRNSTITVPVGVILDLGTLVGKMGMTSISMAVDDFYASHSNFTTRLALHTKDANSDAVQAASAAVELLGKTGVKAIIGPQKSAQATFLSDLANKAQVPLLSFSATSPTLSPTRYFVRTTLNDSSQSRAIAALVKAFGWKEVVPIYEDSDYGRDIIPYLIDAFQETNTHSPYRSVVRMQTTDDQIMEELYKLKTMQTRVFIVQMSAPMGSRLFLKASEAGMMSEGYVWIMTDGLGNVVDSLGTSIIDSMQGALGLRIQVSRDDAFAARWQRRFQQDNPNDPLVLLSAFGRWAYDSVWALALAAEEVQHKNSSLLVQQKATATNSTDMDRLAGVSAIGPALLDAILATRFTGVSGDFRIVDNQLLFSSYQIFNVNGRGGRGVGVWTSEHGISTHLGVQNGALTASSSTSDPVLNPVIWPGESTVVPKGWEIPTSGKKLRIGVPIMDGFREFVDVKVDPVTNAALVTGYCIDVFEAVLQELPYWLPHEYVPFENYSTGRHAATHNDLIFQKYDAVVGDITIRANRALIVDFTLPYTESGIGMIVPVKDSINNNAWIFLKPLTTDLWLGSVAFFFFTGFCVWAMEHRINEEFRGPISRQLGTIFYFSFSTLVFAHRERVENILSRIVVIVWVFVVLILTSSYTASLASMLTVQQLQPIVTEVQELLKNGESVGYQNGSFVLDILKQLNFDESKIRAYDTPEDYAEALSKGSNNGGVAAIVHEIPYIKLFLAQHCTGYTMVGPIYKTAGFGFVFPKGSPLTSDISQGILKVTEGDVINQIEKKWFKDQNSCLNQGTIVTSSNLSFRSFWGLFLITGSTSTCALLIFLAFFTYENWDNLKSIDPDKPVSRRVIGWLKYYNTKDLKYHTFQKDKAIYPKYDIVMDNKSDTELEACNNEQHFSTELSGPYSCTRDGEISSPTDASTTG